MIISTFRYYAEFLELLILNSNNYEGEKQDIYWQKFRKLKRTLKMGIWLHKYGIIKEKKKSTCIKSIHSIENLSKDKSPIVEVPDYIDSISNLESIDLPNCEIIDLPETINNITNLTTLFLPKNKITLIPDLTLNYLHSIILHHNKLNIVPDCITNLPLIYLDISFNYIEKLPENIGNIKTLKFLLVRDNWLIHLPDSICNLENLKEFNILNNQITYIPENIGNLTKLQDFCFLNNRVKILPESIGNLKILEELNFDDNFVNILPNSIGNLQNLKRLDICNNGISELPYTFKNLKRLKTLCMMQNNFTTIPKCLIKIKLESLDIRSCKIKFIPNYINKMSNLSSIWLKNNPIEIFISKNDHDLLYEIDDVDILHRNVCICSTCNNVIEDSSETESDSEYVSSEDENED